MRITHKGKTPNYSFLQNIFYKNIKTKIFEILEHFKVKPEAVILKIFEFCVLKIFKYNTIIYF